MVRAFRDGRKRHFTRLLNPQPTGAFGMAKPPRFAVGDVIFVQERFRVRRHGCGLEQAQGFEDIAFACDFPYNDPSYALMLGWHSALEMGRHLSRTTLLVESVEVRRVQDTDDATALAEGIVLEYRTLDGPPVALVPETDIEAATPREAFALLWDQLNGPGAWEANGWTYSVTCRPVNGNVNCLLHGG